MQKAHILPQEKEPSQTNTPTVGSYHWQLGNDRLEYILAKEKSVMHLARLLVNTRMMARRYAKRKARERNLKDIALIVQVQSLSRMQKTVTGAGNNEYDLM